MEQAGFASTDYFALFFELFQGSSDAVFLARLEDAVVLDVNDSFLALYGLTREQAIGRTPGELRIVVRPEDEQALEDELRVHGRVDRRPIRMRSAWSEEFTLAVSGVVAKWRDTDVILGIGQLVVPGSAEPSRFRS